MLVTNLDQTIGIFLGPQKRSLKNVLQIAIFIIFHLINF